MSDALFQGEICKIIADLQAHDLKISYFVLKASRLARVGSKVPLSSLSIGSQAQECDGHGKAQNA